MLSFNSNTNMGARSQSTDDLKWLTESFNGYVVRLVFKTDIYVLIHYVVS